MLVHYLYIAGLCCILDNLKTKYTPELHERNHGDGLLRADAWGSVVP